MGSLYLPGFKTNHLCIQGEEGWTSPVKGRLLFPFINSRKRVIIKYLLHPLTYTVYVYYILYMTTPHQPKQIKSHWYYVFWSMATIAVVVGQVYVATSYRYLAEALKLTLT